MFDNHVNLLIGTVKVAPVPSTTGDTLTLMPGDGQRFSANIPVTLCPRDQMPIFDNSEIAYVTAVSGDDLTLLRAQEGTNPMQVTSGWQVIGGATAKTFTDIEGALDDKVDKITGKGLSTEDYTSTEKAKLAGIASGATQNAPDASLRDRSTHTGSQPISSVTGLQATLDSKADGDDLADHIGDMSNPHQVTKSQVGLGAADNTSDADKPLSTATQIALDATASNALAMAIALG